MPAKRFVEVCLLALIGISIYVFVCYSHRYNSRYEIGTIVGICGGCLVLMAIKAKSQMSNERHNAVIVRWTGIMAACIVGVYVLRWAHEKYELVAYGQVTKGIVVGFDRLTVKGTLSYHAIVNYELNDRAYTQQFRDHDYVLSTSDTVTMLCSSADPELCTITAYQHNGRQIAW